MFDMLGVGRGWGGDHHRVGRECLVQRDHPRAALRGQALGGVLDRVANSGQPRARMPGDVAGVYLADSAGADHGDAEQGGTLHQ